MRLRRHMDKFSVVLFTRFTTRNQRCLALTKSRDKLRSFSKIYYIYFRRCVARQIIYLLSYVDRQMAMICGHQSKKLPSCVAWQIAMIFFERSNIPSASETNWCSCNGRHLIESFDYKGLQALGGTQFLLLQGNVGFL